MLIIFLVFLSNLEHHHPPHWFKKTSGRSPHCLALLMYAPLARSHSASSEKLSCSSAARATWASCWLMLCHPNLDVFQVIKCNQWVLRNKKILNKQSRTKIRLWLKPTTFFYKNFPTPFTFPLPPFNFLQLPSTSFNPKISSKSPTIDLCASLSSMPLPSSQSQPPAVRFPCSSGPALGGEPQEPQEPPGKHEKGAMAPGRNDFEIKPFWKGFLPEMASPNSKMNSKHV